MKTVLEGKRILLTRPKNQYEEWAAKLSSLGALPISFPLIEIKPVSVSDQIQKTLTKLEQYDWIIFTSYNAAKYFIELSGASGKNPVKSKIAAIGSKTAGFLEQNGYNVDFIPGIYTAAELADSLPGIEGKLILLPRTDIADDELLSGLTNRGGVVDEVIVYTTQKITNRKDELQELINKGLDVVTFASPSVVEAFSEMGIEKNNAYIACIGPVTAEKAMEKGIKPDIIAETYTADGLTNAIIKFFEKNINLEILNK